MSSCVPTASGKWAPAFPILIQPDQQFEATLASHIFRRRSDRVGLALILPMCADPDGLARLKWERGALQIHVNDACTRRRDADVENRSGELHVRLMLTHAS